ncbi:MAG: hypothetical protein PHE53_06855 [Thermoguttaceae bacterium]|nr:hypothetical protein [Thermoguttaceae bacterium]
MSRHAQDGQPISLFSFQDIITSVAAIMLLITLILMLELIQQSEHANTTAPVETVLNLQQQLAAQQAKLSLFRTRMETVTQSLTEQPALTQSEVLQELQSLQAELAQLRLDAKQLTQQEQRASTRFHVAKDQCAALQVDAPNIQSLEEELATLQRERTRLSIGGQMIFNPPPATDRRAWIVDCSQNQAILIPFGWTGQREVFTKTVLHSLKNQFLYRLESCDPQREYFVFFVRPGGALLYMQVLSELQARGYEVGLELIDQDQEIVFQSH